MSINSISKVVSEKLASELSLTVEKKEVIQYGMIFLLSQLLTTALLAVEAILLNMVAEFVILAVCGAVLRRYSGGAHCSSPLRCSLLSLITVPLLVMLSRALYSLNPLVYTVIIILTNVISIGIYYKYAPKDSPAKPIRNKEKIKRLKFRSVFLSTAVFSISIALLYFNYGHASILMTLGSINQAISLTNLGQKYVHTFDKLLKMLLI